MHSPEIFHEFFWNLQSRLFRMPSIAGLDLPQTRETFRTIAAGLRK